MALGESKEFLKLSIFCHKLKKKTGAKLEEVPKKGEKVDVLELDELCVNKKNIWLWTAVDRATKRLVAFQIGTRETKTPKNSQIKLAILTQNFTFRTIGMHTISSTYQTSHWKSTHAYRRVHEQAVASLLCEICPKNLLLFEESADD